MHAIYLYLFPAIWLAYILYWQFMARNVKQAVRTEPGASRLLRFVLMIASMMLLVSPVPMLPFLNRRILLHGVVCFWCGAVVTVAGLLFGVWARRQLGRNWSREVTVMQDHRLITTGPYAFVRHPIYTGLLLALFGSAIAVDRGRGFLAVVLVFLALWRKLRLEEQWMRAQFGQAYADYSRRVAALVPYIF